MVVSLFRRVLALAGALSVVAGAVQAQDATCPNAETAQKGFRITFENGAVATFLPRTGRFGIHEIKSRLPSGAETTVKFLSFDGIMALTQENEYTRFTYVFDRPIDKLVPEGNGEPVEFRFQQVITAKAQPIRIREGTQTQMQMGVEDVAIGPCTYRTRVIIKDTRYSDGESGVNRILFAPELGAQLAWSALLKRPAGEQRFQMKPVRIEPMP
jgi:hypothetical protein